MFLGSAAISQSSREHLDWGEAAMLLSEAEPHGEVGG